MMTLCCSSHAPPQSGKFRNVIQIDVKNGYCERSETQMSGKWSKNAFYPPLAVLGIFKHPLEGLSEIIFMRLSLQWVPHYSFQGYCLKCGDNT
jgi:hypothetical protein